MAVTYKGGNTTHSNPNAEDWTVTVAIASGTLSEAFHLPGIVAFVDIGATVTAGRTLTLQRLETDGSTFVDTELTFTTLDDEAATSRWTSEQMAPYAGLFGKYENLKLKLSASDSITVVFHCTKT
ncbi:MAG: hypothetical protein AAGA75_17480 [Cyanobacteria bacterium P01_E01_bin.6]